MHAKHAKPFGNKLIAPLLRPDIFSYNCAMNDCHKGELAVDLSPVSLKRCRAPGCMCNACQMIKVQSLSLW